jgi:hypothetical protein
MILERDNGNWQDTSTKIWLLPNQLSTTLTTNLPENTEWVVVNPRQTGARARKKPEFFKYKKISRLL